MHRLILASTKYNMHTQNIPHTQIKLARICSLDGFKAQVTECAVTPDAQKREENLGNEKATPYTNCACVSD